MDEVVETVDHPNRGRYELTVDSQFAGSISYAIHNGQIALIHTEIDSAYAGKHLGQRFVRSVLDDARVRRLRVRPMCPFVAAYIRSHPEYQDLVDVRIDGSEDPAPRR
jgi:uncharacterized protein